MTVRNAQGQPFSKWKPADKFAYTFTRIHADITKHMRDEYYFDSARKWRLDFAWPTIQVAVEIDGFGYGHQSQQGMSLDNEKANRALELGWRVFRFNSADLGSLAKVEAAVEQVASYICSVE